MASPLALRLAVWCNLRVDSWFLTNLAIFPVGSWFWNQKSGRALNLFCKCEIVRFLSLSSVEASCVNPTIGSPGNYSKRRPTEDQSMAKKAKRPAKRKASAKKVGKKLSSTGKAAKKTARSVVKSARKKTAAAKKAGKGIIRRAIKAITDVAAPLLPGSTPEKPNES